MNSKAQVLFTLYPGCSFLDEVGLVGPETRVLMTFVLMLSIGVADVGGLEAELICLP